MLLRTFSLEEGGATTGKLWTRACSAHAQSDALDIHVEILGWQWVGRGSWGFAVSEYVYFRATVHALVHAAVSIDGENPSLRVWTTDAPDVTVNALGRVAAHASNPASSLLSVVSSIAGEGPNNLATSSLKSTVRSTIRDRARRGFQVALGEVPPPGLAAKSADTLLDETETLHPGGALISGAYSGDSAAWLDYEVAGEGVALARPVCADEATRLVDGVAEGMPRTTTELPTDVLRLHGRGRVPLDRRGCEWVFVTGAAADEAVKVHIAITHREADDIALTTKRRWVRATVRGYAIDGVGKLFALAVGRKGAPRIVGEPLTSRQSTALGLVAEPVEVGEGEPIEIAITALKPTAREWWSDRITYVETPVGRALVEAPTGHFAVERHAVLQSGEKAVGSVDLDLEAIGAP